jgi:hypothetical protein
LFHNRPLCLLGSNDEQVLFKKQIDLSYRIDKYIL